MIAALQLVDQAAPKPRLPRLKTALICDLFCGAGGSSTGAQRALGRRGYGLDLVAVNHWNVAIDTHSRNHPSARHYCQDVATLRPRVAVPEGKLDLLMASPTCTYHSRARGGRPTSDQQRMDPWHVVTWLTELRVKRLLVENVPEMIQWGPVDERTGRPVKSRRGEYFQSWIQTLQGIGFRVEWRVLNAADYGDATTRERFFLIGRSDGKRIRWPLPTHARRVDGLPGIGPQKRWRAAREIIDWSTRGRSIFDRKKPLSPKMLARIEAGARKFRWPRVFLVLLGAHRASPSKHLGELLELPAVRQAIAEHRGQPNDPLPTVCASTSRIGLVEPFVLSAQSQGTAKSAGEPVPGLTCTTSPVLVEPFVLNRHGENGGKARASSVDDPAPTATTRGAGYVVEPMILPHHRGGSQPRTTEEPIPTITTGEPGYLIEPFVAGTNGVAHSLIAPYYGNAQRAGSVDEPLPTVTTKDRFGVVVPITHSQAGASGAQTTDAPLRTILPSHGGELALVTPVSHDDASNRARSVDEPLPTIQAESRGNLAFIAAQFGERPGQPPRVHSVDAPAPTVAASGHINLVEAREFDILIRTLEPGELAGAMGFTGDEARYEFAGTKTDVIRQIGNAVCVHQAEALVGTLFEE